MRGLVLCFLIFNLHFNIQANKTDHDFYDYNEESALRVVNGRPATITEAPYQISLKTLHGQRGLRQYTNFCGGVLIGETKIATAAHCIAKDRNIMTRCCGLTPMYRLSSFYAVAGSLMNKGTPQPDSLQTGQWRRLYRGFYHKGYVFPTHDVAVVFTKQKFVFNQNVKPISYARKFQHYRGPCKISGFGRINEQIAADILMIGEIALMDPTSCRHAMRIRRNNLICSTSATHTHKGDSGGPLVCLNTGDKHETPGLGLLVGLTSGMSKTPIRTVTFFVRVSSYTRQIKSNRGQDNSFTLNPFSVFIFSFIRYLQ